MKKIPSVFERDWNGDRSRVLPELHKGADVEWVLAGEGVPTVKWDGSACMIRDGQLFARFDCKGGRKPPEGFIAAELEPDPKTGHWPGWVSAMGAAPAYTWHRGAFHNSATWIDASSFDAPPDGTYEAIGPHFQGNPYKLERDVLRRHGVDVIAGSVIEGRLMPWGVQQRLADAKILDAALYAGLKSFRFKIDGMPEEMPIEGVVFHHPDGRMAKVLASDLGLPWKAKTR